MTTQTLRTISQFTSDIHHITAPADNSVVDAVWKQLQYTQHTPPASV